MICGEADSPARQTSVHYADNSRLWWPRWAAPVCLGVGQYATSRNTIRGALRQLISDGLIEARGWLGTYVREYDSTVVTLKYLTGEARRYRNPPTQAVTLQPHPHQPLIQLPDRPRILPRLQPGADSMEFFHQPGLPVLGG